MSYTHTQQPAVTDEVQGVGPFQIQEPALQEAIKADIIQEADSDVFDGTWIRADKKPMGKIKDRQIAFDDSFKELGWDGASVKVVVAPSGNIQMDLLGEVNEAVFRAGPPAQLKWDDDELWIRDSEGDVFDGTWIRTDNKPMAKIKDRQMAWDDSFMALGWDGASVKVFVTPTGAIKMELFGEAHGALFDEGPPAQLRWDDGEVWVKDKC